MLIEMIAQARVAAFREAAMRPVQSSLSFMLEPAVVAGAGVLAFFSHLLGPAHGALAIVLAFLNVLDLLVGGLKAIRDPLDDFDKAKLLGGVLGKLLYWAIALVAVFVEVAGRAILQLLGGDPTLVAMDALVGTGMVVAVVLFLLIIGEGLSILDNIAESLGKRIRALAYLRRLLDAIRWEDAHEDEEMPDRRDYDEASRRFEQDLKARAAERSGRSLGGHGTS